MSKLRTSIDAFLKSESLHAKLDHLTAMEINSVRPLLPHALDQMLRIQSVRAMHRKQFSIVEYLFLCLNKFCFSRMEDWGNHSIQKILNKYLIILLYRATMMLTINIHVYTY